MFCLPARAGTDEPRPSLLLVGISSKYIPLYGVFFCFIMEDMAEETKQQPMTPEEEIRHLEKQLQRKKQELAERGAEQREEKDLFREVLKEHIEAVKPAIPPPDITHIPVPTPPPPVLPPPNASPQDVKELEANQEKVRQLIEKALTGTIEDAVREAQASTPYLLDELHDHLVDDYYEKLLQLRKVEQL